MFVVFFVLCLSTRIVSDMVIVRRMVDDVLNQMIIERGVVHEMTHGVKHNHIIVDFFIICLVTRIVDDMIIRGCVMNEWTAQRRNCELNSPVKFGRACSEQTQTTQGHAMKSHAKWYNC